MKVMPAKRTALASAVVALAALLLFTGAVLAREQDGHSSALVEAERAFSRLAGKIGYIPAFLAYFADDVFTFQPAPAQGKDRLREAAARMAVPPNVTADWEPWFAGAASAGDLGYTTGPSVFTEAATGKVLRRGWYFSVWKHDAYGWRVAADIGVQAPEAGPLRPHVVDVAPAAVGRARSRDDLLGVERQFVAAIASDGLPKAYARYTSGTSRLYRDGSAPVVGTADIEAFLASQPKPTGCRVVEAGISKSGDLAYTAGECEVAPASGAASVKAGFLRVWTSAAAGWSLAADVVTR
jgi:ketosteroid isomerase-like protein